MSSEKAKRGSGTPVVVRFPAAVVKKLDRLAVENGRSRSSEVRQRVLASIGEKARA